MIEGLTLGHYYNYVNPNFQRVRRINISRNERLLIFLDTYSIKVVGPAINERFQLYKVE